MLFEHFSLFNFLITISALIICITVHEFAHAYAAYRAGDDTPRAQGRISLNPIDHLDPMGTVMMIMSTISGFGIGWGKAVRINPANFRNPRWDDFRVSLWGPLSNILTAFVVGMMIRFWGVHMTVPVYAFLQTVVMISLVLALFNLIPIAPLDGSHILTALLPYEQAKNYSRFMAQYGLFMLLGLIFLGGGLLGRIIGPPMHFLWVLFTGIR